MKLPGAKLMIDRGTNIVLPGDSQKRRERGGRVLSIRSPNIWTPNAERQIRDLRAVRAILERRRRRPGVRRPICSTTFGGHTVPFVFGGVGGGPGPGGLIRVTGVGSIFNSDLQGAPHSMDIPATAPGDKLFFVSVGFNFGSGVPVEAPAQWTGGGFLTCGDNTGYQTYSRNATADANDACTIPATLSFLRLYVAVVYNVTSDIPTEPASTLTTYQGSALNDTFSGANTSWDFFLNPTMSAGPNNQRFVQGHAQAIRAAVVGGTSVDGIIGDGDGNPLNVSVNFTHTSTGAGNVTQANTIWWQEAWRYDEVAAPVAGGALAYSPLTTNRCQYNRCLGQQTS